MKRRLLLHSLLLVLFAFSTLSFGCGETETSSPATPEARRIAATYRITTPHGDLVVGLYEGTPRHLANFDSLARAAFYDSTTFHRVIADFMIQGGDPNSKDDDPFNDGGGSPGYTIPAEFHPDLFHKKGALAAARQGDHVNPEKRSSGSQFYIVQGEVFTAEILDQMEAQKRQANPNFRFSEEQREIYTTLGGTPFLDGDYTVFGEVVEGMDVLEKIAAADTPRRLGQPAHPALQDQPLEKIPMTVRPRR